MAETNEEAGADDEGPAPASGRRGLLIASTYRVTERIGSGNVGDVYEAEHIRLGRPVAVKFLRGDITNEQSALRRFRREAEVLARLDSEHIVRILDCGKLRDGTPYLVMERLPGEDLRKLLAASGPLPVRRAVELVIHACRGLTEAHAAGLVHRDLKPANLFVVRRPRVPESCKILDFGVAKSATSEATQRGAVVGTVRYMAPEQLMDSASVGPRTDVYALGATLYECTCGVPPHAADTVQELMFSILNRDVPPPRTHCPNLPPELERVILRALARDPERRFASAMELARALAPFAWPSDGRREAFDPTETTGVDDTFDHTGNVVSVPRTRSPKWTLTSGVLGAIAGAVAMAWLLPGPRATTLSVMHARPSGWRAAAARIEAPRPRPADLAPASPPVPARGEAVSVARALQPAPTPRRAAPASVAAVRAPAPSSRVAPPSALPLDRNPYVE